MKITPNCSIQASSLEDVRGKSEKEKAFSLFLRPPPTYPNRNYQQDIRTAPNRVVVRSRDTCHILGYSKCVPVWRVVQMLSALTKLLLKPLWFSTVALLLSCCST